MLIYQKNRFASDFGGGGVKSLPPPGFTALQAGQSCSSISQNLVVLSFVTIQ